MGSTIFTERASLTDLHRQLPLSCGIPCRMCGGLATSSLGSLPDMHRFAGVLVTPPIAGGELLICDNCKSMQRHPILGPQDYGSLYRDGTDSVWSSTTHRPDHDRVRAYINDRCRPASILDVGCNTGGFFRSLPNHIQKYGVEPSAEASRIASLAGIDIIAADLSEVPLEMRFDCITLIDVIEHVPEPGQIIDSALALLSPTGQLIISTGNPETPEWTDIFGSHFWYASFAEHISFPSQLWMSNYVTSLGFKISHREVFRYGVNGYPKNFVKWFLQESFLRCPKANYVLSWLLFRDCNNPFSQKNLFLPCAGVYEDHHLICISRS